MAVKLELYRVFHEVARMGNISAAGSGGRKGRRVKAIF